MEKNTAQFKYVVKSVPLSVITVPLWNYAKHFVLRGYCNASDNINSKCRPQLEPGSRRDQMC